MPALLTVLAAGVFDLQREGNITPFLLVFAFGFAVGIGGHLSRSTDLVIAGILIAGVAAVMPMLLWA